MSNVVSANLEALKGAMKALKPAGAKGFEGLLAVVLARISGHDFRLAKSGAQNGKDGASQSAIAFEAKRYDRPIPDDQVVTKVFRAGAAATPPHLWILGATVEVSTQLVDVLTAGAERLGVGLLLLDWPDASAFPPLALACAMAPEETVGFLTRQAVSAQLVAEAASALRDLKNAEGFVEASGILAARLREPSLALPGARAANQTLLREAFGDRRKAQLMLGQALAPGSDAALPTRDRAELTGQPTGQVQIRTGFVGAVKDNGDGTTTLHLVGGHVVVSALSMDRWRAFLEQTEHAEAARFNYPHWQ